MTGTVALPANTDAYFDPRVETLAVSALRELQLERLRAAVAAACEHSATYRELCGQAGVSPGDIETLADVRKLPFLEKDTAREAYPFGLLTCERGRVLEVHTTSGTTGKPIPIFATRRDMENWAALNARSLWMIGLRPGDLLQNCFSYGLATGVGFHYGAQHMDVGVVPAGIGRHELQIDLLVDLGVTAIATTPSYGLYLADRARERGFDLARDAKLRFGLFGAEPWPESARARLESTLGIEAFNEFGMGEFLGPGMACECPQKDGMHVWSDAFLVECIDPTTGEWVEDGAPGELVWTSLVSESMALIRYRSHDMSSLTWSPCACGRTHPRIGKITGRSDDALSIGAYVVFPSQVEAVLTGFEEFANNFCMVLETSRDRDQLTLQVEIRELGELGEQARERLAARVAAATKSAIGVTPRVELAEPMSLPRMTTGDGKTACHRVDDRRGA
jgi:phenylacetate-CoA ligase